MATREALFLRTLQDIEERIAPGKDDYEVLMVAALLRKLLLDGDPLVHQINRNRKLKVQFTAVHRRPPTDRATVLWTIQDGLDPDTAFPRLGGEVVRVSLDKFMALPVAAVEGVVIDIGSLIRYLAHVEGAIHAGTPGNDKERAIAKFSNGIGIGGMESGAVRAMLAIGRVTLKALQPLRQQMRAGSVI